MIWARRDLSSFAAIKARAQSSSRLIWSTRRTGSNQFQGSSFSRFQYPQKSRRSGTTRTSPPCPDRTPPALPAAVPRRRFRGPVANAEVRSALSDRCRCRNGSSRLLGRRLPFTLRCGDPTNVSSAADSPFDRSGRPSPRRNDSGDDQRYRFPRRRHTRFGAESPPSEIRTIAL